MTASLKTFVVLMVAAVLSLALAGCGGDDGPGPERAVEEALAALEARDPVMMASFFAEDQRQFVVSGLDFILERIDEIRVSDLQTRVVSSVEGAATVEAEYNLETVSSAGTGSSHIVRTVPLVEEAGEWRISDLSLLE